MQSKKALIYQPCIVGKSNSTYQVLMCQKLVRQINGQVKKSFLVVLETSTLAEVELSEYCRAKGLYPEKIKAWKQELSLQAPQ